ncbi:hypothetical protein [Sphingomonas sp. Leaf343]|uniref:hypothetical protein n=1 Tax=Sphingomonas sp. Leaf343 TaxID=1736345 RepID=UPI000AF68C1F|nr:hypothetical protein [Sphingomonas sp. Leaf343]
MRRAVFRPYRLAIAQCAAVAALLGGSILVPPAEGAMLLVPLLPARTAATIDLALDHGARIGGLGPLPGSLIVRGQRAHLFAPLMAKGILTLAAPTIWCGR